VKFQRSALGPLNRDSLRTVGARSGWLIETPDVIRVGAGRIVEHIELAGGLGATTSATVVLSRHELRGDDGPAGTGVVAF
jgi:hypothetical protein